jgi:hypothetical protein
MEAGKNRGRETDEAECVGNRRPPDPGPPNLSVDAALPMRGPVTAACMNLLLRSF